MCFCSLEHSPAFSAHVHWNPYFLPACEIYAIGFSTVGRNLEKHMLFVAPDLWRSDCTVVVGSVYIPVFLRVVVFVMPFAICLSYFLDFVFIAVFVELHFT
jgi:hypothetical protein